jgi:hypothetical protein
VVDELVLKTAQKASASASRLVQRFLAELKKQFICDGR